MTKIIRNGIRVYQLISWDDSHDQGRPINFQNKTSARLFLQRFLNDHTSMMTLRDIMRNKYFHYDIHRLSNQEIIDQLSGTLACGALKIVKLPDETESWVYKQFFYKEDDYVAPMTTATAKDVNWITFKVLEDTSGMPIPDIMLSIKLPGGATVDKTTNEKGLIEISDINEGDCAINTDIKNAKLENTLAFIGMGEPAIDKKKNRIRSSDERSGFRYLALVEQHKVKKGDSLDSIATANGLTWKQLALFNWGTDDPQEINEFLRRRVGCTKKTRDGLNYIFGDADDPGILDIPKPWNQSGFATSKTHVIRVRQVMPVYLVLENDEGMPIPEAAYELTYESGASLSGTLGRTGIARIEDLAEPTFEVEYPDEDDVLVKAIAGSVRKSFDDRNTEPVFWLFEHGQETVETVIQAYDNYFNDLGGSGLLEDIYQEITDENALLALEALMTFNGIPTRSEYALAWSEEKEDLEDALPLEEAL